jgi:hypothetical protein
MRPRIVRCGTHRRRQRGAPEEIHEPFRRSQTAQRRRLAASSPLPHDRLPCRLTFGADAARSPAKIQTFIKCRPATIVSGKEGDSATTGSGEFSTQKFDELLYLCIIIFNGHGTYAYIASMGDLVAIVHNAIYRISRRVIKRPDLCCNGRIERM